MKLFTTSILFRVVPVSAVPCRHGAHGALLASLRSLLRKGDETPTVCSAMDLPPQLILFCLFAVSCSFVIVVYVLIQSQVGACSARAWPDPRCCIRRTARVEPQAWLWALCHVAHVAHSSMLGPDRPPGASFEHAEA